MSLTDVELREIVTELVTRPRHEKVRTLIYKLLVDGLGASSTEVDFERPVPEVHGRIDALLGRTIFEFKSDLRRETRDAEEELTRYLGQRESETGQRFVGIATDGSTFIPYELRSGSLRSLQKFDPSVETPRDLLGWLSSVVSVSDELDPTPETVSKELGRASLAWALARQDLQEAWEELTFKPEVRLKRSIWAQLMGRVYGSAIDDVSLFFQHTYLSIVAKTMATHVLGMDVPDPVSLLSGRPFQQSGIGGVVESDFFDWIVGSEKGRDLVRRIALQAGRFRLRDVQTDVLKGLYESLVDREQRHDLGEYYTPDWLAEKICAEAIDHPLEQRVMDPACGSGTFLFHAVRRLLTASDQAGLSPQQGLEKSCEQIFGVDIHPVAVQIARVTFLLALGEGRLAHRPASFTVPVYLGDSLQWSTRGFMAEQEVLIEVPEGNQLLAFPFESASEPAVFASVIDRMLELSAQDASGQALTSWLERTYDFGSFTVETLGQTYETLRQLHREGRDHIWGFVARNLVRPVWLSQENQRADVVVGNPPWLAYRHMDRQIQLQFREECQRRGLWTGGRVATHQDLSAYFFAKCVELYLKPTGVIAFVMPYAAMTRAQYEGFRSGIYGSRRRRGVEQVFATVRFTAAWVMSDDVQPLFPVPSCVLFAHPGQGDGSPLPSSVLVAAGTLPKRDATAMEAEHSLSWSEEPWPMVGGAQEQASPYRDAFRQGATIVPRVLTVVEYAPVGSLGENPGAPLVRSRRSNQEKIPWKDLPALRDNVEREFLRMLYLGESVAPFRLLEPALAVIPWEESGLQLLDAKAAQESGYMYLANWLNRTEQLWEQHGRGGMSFQQQIDYFGKLSAQFPIKSIRVLFSASGTLPAAVMTTNIRAIVEHSLYSIGVRTEAEGLYLCAVLNSETARSRVQALQARGQWGARHFDKVMFSLPIPLFEPGHNLHMGLAQATVHAQEIAGAVELQDGMHFVRARRLIRTALQEDGVSQRIDGLVAELLDGATQA